MTEQDEMWTPKRLMATWRNAYAQDAKDHRERCDMSDAGEPSEDAHHIANQLSYVSMNLQAVHSVLHHIAVALDRQGEADEQVNAMMAAAQDLAAGLDNEWTIQPKPTIAELEALDKDDDIEVDVLPSGEIRTRKKRQEVT